MSSRFLILRQSHNDSVLGLASVIDAMVILGLVLNNCSDTANRATDITCNATRVSKENPMGWIGLKRQVMPTKAATHQYLRRFNACTNTNTAPAGIAKSKYDLRLAGMSHQIIPTRNVSIAP